MSDKTAIGDRMKMYEQMEPDRFLPLLPVYARIDGKCFSKFTKNLERPFDPRFSQLMVDTTKYLVEQTNACVGYTQSDEISLLFYSNSLQSQIFMDGRKQKIISILASVATAYFNSKIPQFIPEKTGKLALFDCRAKMLPNKMEATNAFLWREQDATKNSISMAARHYYSAKELFDKNGAEMQEMLFQKGVNWNDYPTAFKRGTYVQRKTIHRAFTTDEIARLPAKHEARNNPNLTINRRQVSKVDMPPLGKVINRIEVLFNGADPEVNTDA
jgi:tRNA(His) guanylyltransferase